MAYNVKGQWTINDEGDLVFEFDDEQKMENPKMEKANLTAPDLLYFLSLYPQFDEDSFILMLTKAARKVEIRILNLKLYYPRSRFTVAFKSKE